ncbi:MAG: V-type ATP synthase subunit E [Finegoldia sp.]|nr:V-type ATP synthase subunit E [Finegoldia sp.]
MSNLDNIINKILDDAKAEADGIIQEANVQKDNIVKAKVDQANSQKEKILRDTQDQAKSLIDRTIAQWQLKSRDSQNQAKLEVVDDIIAKVKEDLSKLPTETYKNYVEVKLKNIDLGPNDELILQEDKREELKDHDFGIKISDDTVKDGFCVDHGDVLVNNKFSDLIDSIREELELEISNVLFNK